MVVYIGLGSNLNSPEQQLRSALAKLDNLQNCQLLQASSFYRSKPMGPSDQPDYINAVAKLITGLEAEELLEHLQAIETSHGRVRGEERWGPRTLDLDILLYGDKIISQPELTIPHAGLSERSFVLYPLSEIAPELDIPGLGALASLLVNCPANDLEVVATE